MFAAICGMCSISDSKNFYQEKKKTNVCNGKFKKKRENKHINQIVFSFIIIPVLHVVCIKNQRKRTKKLNTLN